MDDKQPRLNTSSKFFLDSDDDHNENYKSFSFDKFSDGSRRYSGKKTNDKYRKLDDTSEHNGKAEAVSVFRIFQFADRVDFLLMFIATCFMVMFTLCSLANLTLFGRLTGIFAIESFADNCHHQRQILTDTNKYNITCPLGIDLNSFNFDHLHKLCRHSDGILPSKITPSISLFREKVMDIIHWLLIIGVGALFSAWMGIVIWMMSIQRQASRMNVFLFRSLLQRNITYFDTTPTNQFNAELFTNIETIKVGIGFEFLSSYTMLFFLIGGLVVSFIINWQFALIMLCLITFVTSGSWIFGKIIANDTTNKITTYSKAGKIVQEVFSSLRTVLSLNGSKYEQKRYEEELHPTRWSSVRNGAVLGIFMGWLSLITYITYPVGFIFGSLIMSYEDPNRSNITDILVIISVLAPNMSYLGSIGIFFQSFSEARAAAAPVFQRIDEAQDTSINETDLWREDDALDIGLIHDINGDIEFDNVNFIYPSRKDVSVLRNLSLTARAGQTTALVGSSGCALLLRQYELSSGRIKIGDRSITNYNLKQLRQSIGVVNQEPILFNMSIYENIRFGKVNATRAEIEEAARQANAHHFIMRLPNKYETLVGERGIQLSGGEKQRIALARALVKQPAILLLDEATSALDNVSEKIVQEALNQACKNRTTLVIAHRLTTIQNAHQIYVLDNGSVFEEGTHETLMAKEGGKYQAMAKKQQLGTINDDQDDLMNRAQVIDEDEQSIFQCNRSLTDDEAVDENKENSTSSKRKSIFLRLLSMNSPEWIIILIGCIVCVMNGATQTIFSILLPKLVSAFNYCIHSERQHEVLISSFLLLLLCLLLLILRFLQYTAFVIAGSKLTQRIRLKTFACLLRQEIAYFDRPENSSAAISVRLSSDVSALEQIVGTRLGVICEAFAFACFGLIFGIFFSWQLTNIIFCTSLFIGIVTYLNVRMSLYRKKQSDLILQRANTFAVEVIHNIRTIKQLSVEKEVLRQYSELIQQVFRMSWKSVCLSAVVYSVIWGIDAYVVALLYWRALILFEENILASDDIIMVFAFAIFATQSLRIVGLISERIGSSVSAVQSFFDLFDRTPTIDNTSTEGQELVNFRGDIEFDQVKFVYPARPTSTVLKKFQLTVKSGQRVALVGTSGCGKSTIIQLLERFYDVTHGQVFLDGVDVRQLNIQWVRSRLGLVGQEPVLFDLTIAENITYGLENASMEEIINAATKANIHQFIAQLPQGYETKVGMKGSFLSGGEKQRIAIARILIRRPKVLLFDEATSALDSYNEQIVQQALEQAQTEDPSRTSLIIAHRLSTIRSCDLICVLDNGHIAESGTHTELIQRRGIYYRMLSQHSS